MKSDVFFIWSHDSSKTAHGRVNKLDNIESGILLKMLPVLQRLLEVSSEYSTSQVTLGPFGLTTWLVYTWVCFINL